MEIHQITSERLKLSKNLNSKKNKKFLNASKKRGKGNKKKSKMKRNAYLKKNVESLNKRKKNRKKQEGLL